MMLEVDNASLKNTIGSCVSDHIIDGSGKDNGVELRSKK